MGEILAKREAGVSTEILLGDTCQCKLEKDVLIVSAYLWTMLMRNNVKMDPTNPL